MICAGPLFWLWIQSGGGHRVALTGDTARLAKCDVVFVGSVIRVGPEPMMVTGRGGVARQQVDYEVRTVLRGVLVGEELTVHHGVLRGPASDRANNRLAPQLFQPGRVLLVGASVSRAAELEYLGYYKFVDDSERACVVEGDQARFHGAASQAVEDLQRALRGENRR